MVDRVDNIHGDSGYVDVTDRGDGAAPETSALTDDPGDFGPSDAGSSAQMATQMAMDETVIQVAAANPTIENVPTPATGGKTVIQVNPGVHYAFDFPLSQAELVLSEGDLHILIKGGGEIVLKGYSEAVAAGEIPPIDFAGQTIAALDLLSQVATAEQLAEIAPAAGPAAGGPGNTGAAFSPYQPGPLPPGIPGDIPLPPTALGFAPPEVSPFVLPAEALAALAAPLEVECFNFALPQLESFFTSMSALTIEKPEEAPPPAPHPVSFFNGVITDLGDGNDFWFGNTSSVENDSIVGGAGNDSLYGFLGEDWLEGGTGNDVVSGGEGNDSIFGGDGNDKLAGDFIAGSVSRSAVAETGESVTNFNDVLAGGNGNDSMAGDAIGTEVWLGATASGTGAHVNAFNDYLSGGDGADTMAGDVIAYGYGNSVTLTAEADGFGNSVFAFNDTMFGGAGDDVMAGDVADSVSGSEPSISLGAYGFGVGNTVNAFNDVIVGGTGDDTLVGDVGVAGWASYYLSVNLSATASGSDNTVNAFNDQLFADSNDLLVGDIAVSVGGSAYNEIIMWAYGWGYGNGVDAYNDYLDGGTGRDRLVGDVLQSGGEGFVRTYGFAIGYGVGNDVYAFNDKLISGAEGFAGSFSGRICDAQFSGSVSGALHEATLVGDVLQFANNGGDVFLLAGGEGEDNNATAYNDHLEGGKVLVGDVVQDGSNGNYDQVNLLAGVAAAYGFGGEGFHEASNNVFAFNDHLIGGDDSITGSLTLQNPSFTVQQLSVDQTFAGGEGAVLVGDVVQYGYGGQYGSFDRVDLGAGHYGFGYGNGDQVVAFNDSIEGGDNTFDLTLGVAASVTGVGCFDELLSGVGIFADLMVGDVYRTGMGEANLLAYGFGQESVAAFNDTMTGGSDAIGIDITFEDTAKSAEINANELAYVLGAMGDVMVGDVYQVTSCGAEGNVNLTAAAVNFTSGEDSIYAFNDEIIGGSHEIDITGDATVVEGKSWCEIPGDVLVGDVLAQGTDQSVGLVAYGFGVLTHLCVYNDTITAGQDIVTVNGEAVPVTGIQDTLVGDVWMEVGKGEQGGEIWLNASVYGFGNHMEAYSDVITDGDGDNILVGDVWYDIGKCASGPSQYISTSGSAYTDLTAVSLFAGAYGFGGGGEGFGGNEVHAFNDTLVSGDGDNVLVGDVWHEVGKFGVGESIHIDDRGYASNSSNYYYYDYYRDYARAYGYGFGAEMSAHILSGNDTVSAYNDELTAGIGSNVLVGDVSFDVSSCAQGQNIEITQNVCKDWGEITLNGGFSYYYNLVQNSAFAVAVADGIGMFAAAEGFDNVLNAYNDQLTAIPGGEGCINDTLVGDAWYHVGKDGTGANISISQKVDLTATIYVAGGAYGQVLDRADAFAAATGIWMGAGAEGDSNTVSAYNDALGDGDALSGGSGNHVLVGDAWYQVEDCATGQHIGVNQHVQMAGSILSDGYYATASIYAAAYGYGYGISMSARADGTSNDVSAFNDELSTGNGGHVLVGDAWYDIGDWAAGQTISVNQCVGITSSDVTYDLDYLNAYANAYVETAGIWMSAWANGGNDTVAAYNDVLTAGSGESVLVGDAWFDVGYGGTGIKIDVNQHFSLPEVPEIQIESLGYVYENTRENIYGYGIVASAYVDGFSNTMSAYNDTLTVGDGFNALVGDAWYEVADKATGIKVCVSQSGPNQSANVFIDGVVLGLSVDGSDNTATAFNDTLTAGNGDSLLVGDVWYDIGSCAQGEAVYINQNGSGYTNTNTSAVHTWVGVYGFGNIVSAHNDLLQVGDGPTVEPLSVLSGPVYNNEAVGDVFASVGAWGSGGDVDFYVQNSGDNAVTLFEDTIVAGNGDDLLVGDVRYDVACSGNGGDIHVSLINETLDEGSAGTVNAFNDTIVGDSVPGELNGNDFLAGDVYTDRSDGDCINVTIINDEGGTAAAFNDSLEGGGGGDILVGDFAAANMVAVSDTFVNINVYGSGSFFGDNLQGGDGDDALYGDFYGIAYSDVNVNLDGDATLFADTLDGGAGNDTLDGGLGDDLLTGGGGNDTFVFDSHSSTVVGGIDGSDGHDTVAGFDRANDVLQFDHVFDGAGPDALADLEAQTTVTDGGAGGSVTVDFQDGAQIVFSGIGTAGNTIDTIAELVTNASHLIVTNG